MVTVDELTCPGLSPGESRNRIMQAPPVQDFMDRTARVLFGFEGDNLHAKVEISPDGQDMSASFFMEPGYPLVAIKAVARDGIWFLYHTNVNPGGSCCSGSCGL